jgi:signal transduction histidine kinase/CheY-like chemotaxis protein
MLKNLYHKLTNIGLAANLPIEVAERVKLLNVFSLFPILTFTFFIVWGIIGQHYYPAAMASIMLASIFYIFHAQKKGKYGIAKSIFFCISSFSLLVIQNALDIDFTITGYFFPLIIAFLLLFDVKKEQVNFTLTFLFTVLCLLGCFLLPGHIVYTYTFTEAQYNASIIMSYSIPFVLIFKMLFVMVRLNANSQETLVKARQEAEAGYKAKSNFLSTMSHELRTPLNGIVGVTNILKHEQVTASQKGYIDILAHSSDQMLNLINHILDFSKIEIGKIHLDKNTFNVQALLQKIAQTFEGRVSNDVKLEVHIDPALHTTVVSDDLRLLQVLNNLLSNAFKFTKKGTVQLSAKIISKQNDEITIAFAVSDTGLGIKETELSRIFESFEQADNSTTRNFGGTGLGLSISKQLVELFNGKLKVESQYGKGSTFSFTVTMPLSKEMPVCKMDDEKQKDLNMIVLTTFLRKWNVQFTKATNGIEALEQFSHKKFDLILMDLEMPEMDGYTAITEIRKKDKDLPVLAFTAALYDDMGADLVGRGFNDYVHKPFNPALLFNKLNEYALAG